MADDSARIPLWASDLKYASCWICSEEEVRVSDRIQLHSVPGQSTGLKSRSRFIHPCKCSLIAHEKCLLSWIRQHSHDRPGTVIMCPQCKAPYQLEQPRSILLSSLECVSSLIRSAMPVGASALAVAGVWLMATAHGSWSIRMFLGDRVARRFLKFPWPLHVRDVFTDNKYWIDLPLIPFMLIGSRLPVFANLTTWLPTLAFMPLTDTLNPRPVRFRATTRMFASRNYPPDLMMTALALPWLRVMYLACKRFVYRQLLLPRPQRPVSNANRGSRMVLMGDQPNFGVLIDSQEAAMDTYETLDDGTLVGTGLATDRDDDQVLLEDLDLYVMEHQRVPVNIFVTIESLSKLLVQALGFPLVANMAGGFLAGLARYSDVIRRWLGIAPGVVPENDLANWLKILRTGWMDPGQRRLYAAWKDQDASFMLDDMDPVWFRNLLGGGMYIVVKDMFVLLYRYLRKQQRQQLRIKDLPFSEGVARELNKAQE